MADLARISELTAGTPPYSAATLFELSVPAGGGTFNSRKGLLGDVASAVGGALGLAPIAVSGSASDLSTGTIPAARMAGSYTFTLQDGALAGATALPASGQITADGRLGLGAAPATVNFGISGTGQPAAQVKVTDSTTTGVAYFSALADAGELDMQANVNGRTNVRYGITLGGWAEISLFNGSSLPTNGLIIGVSPAKPIVFGTGNAERARIDGTGNFGIANKSPQARLHVGVSAGTARISNAWTDAANGEWAYLGDWGFAAGVATYGTNNNGTGVARDVSIVRGGTEVLRFAATTISTVQALGIGAVPAAGSLYVQGANTAAYAANTIATGVREYIANSDLTAGNMSRLVFAGSDTGGTVRNAVGLTAVLTHNATSVDGELAIQTAVAGVSAERLRIGATLYSGYQLLLGNLSSTAMTIAGVSNQGFQIASTGGSSRINNIRYSADITAPAIFFAKSRGTLPTAGAVVSGDALMEIRAVADDGSTNSAVTITSAYFQALVDGTVSTGVVPSRFSWSVTSAAGALAERMRLSAAGNLGIGNTDPQARLTIGTAGNPGTARTYNTYTDPSNGEWAYLGDWSGSAARYGTDMNGTGAARNSNFYHGGTQKLWLTSNGLGIGAAPSAAVPFEITNNADTILQAVITNTDAGVTAQARTQYRNDLSNGQLMVGVTGTGFTTSGALVQDAGVISAAGGLSGGLSIVTSANAPIRFYSNGNNERMRIFEGGDIRLGSGTALATNATAGFPKIPTSAGAPTGVPGNASTGSAEIEYDSTNKKLMVYDNASGTWKGVVLT